MANRLDTPHGGAKCTLCSKVPSDGFYTGCMVKDLGPQNGWDCDGQGHLTRLDERRAHMKHDAAWLLDELIARAKVNAEIHEGAAAGAQWTLIAAWLSEHYCLIPRGTQ
jgi:hypothetical protein